MEGLQLHEKPADRIQDALLTATKRHNDAVTLLVQYAEQANHCEGRTDRGT